MMLVLGFFSCVFAQEPGVECVAEDIETTVREGIMGPPLKLALVTPCTNMGDHLKALRDDLTKTLPIETETICECVEGFDRDFWATNLDCELLTGVKWVDIYDTCAANEPLVRPDPVDPEVTTGEPTNAPTVTDGQTPTWEPTAEPSWEPTIELTVDECIEMMCEYEEKEFVCGVLQDGSKQTFCNPAALECWPEEFERIEDGICKVVNTRENQEEFEEHLRCVRQACERKLEPICVSLPEDEEGENHTFCNQAEMQCWPEAEFLFNGECEYMGSPPPSDGGWAQQRQSYATKVTAFVVLLGLMFCCLLVCVCAYYIKANRGKDRGDEPLMENDNAKATREGVSTQV